MTDTYKGESPSKKFARYIFWRDLLYAYPEDFRRRRLVFLASRCGGDASVLRAMGVPDAHMLAVERDRCAAEDFAEAYPSIPLHNGDVADAVERLAQDALVVFLDFCGQLSPSTFETVRRVSNAMRLPQSSLGVAVMRGRESDVGSVDIMSGANRRYRRLWRSMQKRNSKMPARMREAILGESVGVKSLLSDTPKTGSVDESRAVAMWHALVSNPINREVCLERLYNYRSATDGGNGVPMTIATLVHRKCDTGDYLAIPVPVLSDKDIREMVLRGRITSIEGKPTDCEDVAGLLNVPKATAAAWRAHATMGTYAPRHP